MSGRPSATRPEHVEEDFSANFPVLDGGTCSKGLESTTLLYRDPEWVIVRLGALSAEQLVDAPFILGFKERQYPAGKRVIVLGSLFHPEQVAENLYQALRQLDQEGASLAWVDMDFPRQGLWQTIAERLMRAGEG